MYINYITVICGGLLEVKFVPHNVLYYGSSSKMCYLWTVYFYLLHVHGFIFSLASPCLPQQLCVSLLSQFDGGDMCIYHKPLKATLSLWTIHRKRAVISSLFTSSSKAPLTMWTIAPALQFHPLCPSSLVCPAILFSVSFSLRQGALRGIWKDRFKGERCWVAKREGEGGCTIIALLLHSETLLYINWNGRERGLAI